MKHLLAFFGELRDFEYVISSLNDLDKVDIVISTWNTARKKDGVIAITEDSIKKVLPNVKQVYITDSDIVKVTLRNESVHKTNTKRIIYHWKKIINNLENLTQYDNIIFHRIDLISNWHTILKKEIDKDTIHLHTNDYIYAPTKESPTSHWCNDYYFYGDVTIVNKFINNLKDTSWDIHNEIYDTLITNNINYKNHVLRGVLSRDCDLSEIRKTDYLALIKGPNNF